MESSENISAKRFRKTTNRYGTRESTMNYDSFFENQHESVSVQADQTSFSEAESFCEKKNEDEGMIKLIIATVNIVTKQIIQMSHRIQRLESKSIEPIKKISIIPLDSVSHHSNHILDFTLPIDQRHGLEGLESKLNNRSVKMLLISHLKRKYESSTPSSMRQPLSTLVYLLIAPGLLSQYTWTGKSGSEKKSAFKPFIAIQDVLFRTMREIKGTYSWEQFKKELVYHILKYAYRNTKSLNIQNISLDPDRSTDSFGTDTNIVLEENASSSAPTK